MVYLPSWSKAQREREKVHGKRRQALRRAHNHVTEEQYIDDYMRRGDPCPHCRSSVMTCGTSLQAYVGGAWRWSCCGRPVLSLSGGSRCGR